MPAKAGMTVTTDVEAVCWRCPIPRPAFTGSRFRGDDRSASLLFGAFAILRGIVVAAPARIERERHQAASEDQREDDAERHRHVAAGRNGREIDDVPQAV